MTSQDLKKGIDITGLTTVTGSELIQLVDAGRLADDKGMNIFTVDTAVDVPDVPNPDLELEGVTPTWWKRYSWVRIPHPDQGLLGVVKVYHWNPNAQASATYLQWEDINNLANLASVQAAQALQVGQEAQVTADEALTNSNTAINEVNTLEATITELQTLVNNISNQVSELGTVIPVGFVAYTAAQTSIINPPTGYLFCDGASLSRSEYAILFAQIGTTYGAADGDHFNLPNIGCRVIVAAGGGGGALSERIVGTTGGSERVILTGAQSGIRAHSHTLPGDLISFNGAAGTTGQSGGNFHVGANAATGEIAAQNASESHENMMPFIVLRAIIKY